MAVELTDGDILLYTLRALYQGQTILNTWHLKVTQFTPHPVDYEDAANSIMDELDGVGVLTDQLEALVVNTYQFIDHRIQRVYPTRNRAIVKTLGTFGTVATAGSTVNQAAVITKYGNVAGRFAVGSWHQAGLPLASYTSTGTITTETRAALTEAVQELTAIGDLEIDAETSINPILWSSKVPARVTPITEIVAQATARVMRRRTVGLGI